MEYVRLGSTGLQVSRICLGTMSFGNSEERMVNYIGASSMFAWQFTKALYTSDLLNVARFVSMQNHYNLCYREEEQEMIPLCKEQKIALLPWSPLARGFLTGRYTRGGK